MTKTKQKVINEYQPCEFFSGSFLTIKALNIVAVSDVSSVTIGKKLDMKHVFDVIHHLLISRSCLCLKLL